MRSSPIKENLRSSLMRETNIRRVEIGYGV